MTKRVLTVATLVAAIFLPLAAHAGETLLVDDYQLSSLVNQLGGVSGGDEELPGRLTPGFSWKPDFVLGRGGRALKLDYDVSSSGSFTFFWMKLGPVIPGSIGVSKTLDLSNYNYLSFWVKGAKGKEKFKVELHQDRISDGRFDFGKDISSFVYVSAYLPRGITNEWQKVVIPLKEFPAISDWSQILEMVFTFENRVGNTKGTVYVDDVLFGCAGLNSGDSILNSSQLPAELSILSPELSELSGTEFGPENELSIRLADKSELSIVEGAGFEYSNDSGKSWQLIGMDYDTKDRNFKLNWRTVGLASSEKYDIRAFVIDIGGDKTYSNTVKNCTIRSISMQDFLEMVSHAYFEYFWDNQDADTGLFADTSGGGDASTGVSGFGLTALAIGTERGWVDKDEAKARALKCLYTFIGDPENPSKPKAWDKSGFFYHFLDMKTAKRAGKCEVSTVDTALLICGALTAGEYFGGKVKEAAQILYKNADWQEYLQIPMGLKKEMFTMGWAPERGYLTSYWDFYTDEGVIISLLAIGSPSYSVNSDNFYSWKRRKDSYKKMDPYIYTWHGALFAHQYAHAWFDLREKIDRKKVNWWENSRNATLANRRFAINNSGSFSTYGPYSWGVTSMDHPDGYTMHFGIAPCGRGETIHDGTISPSGPAGSIVFTPILSIRTLESLYYTYPHLWGRYGFRDSFNLDKDWVSRTYFGLGHGISLLAMENFRSGFVWKNFMKNDFIKKAFSLTGFKKAPAEAREKLPEIKSVIKQIEKAGNYKNPDELNYLKAKAYFDRLRRMEEIDSPKLGKIYVEEADSFYEKIEERLVSSIDGIKDKERTLLAQALLLLTHGRKFQHKKVEAAFKKLASLMREFGGDESTRIKALNKVATELTREGFGNYALQLRVNSIPGLKAESKSEVIKKLKLQADSLFQKKDLENAEPIYNQCIKLVSQYSAPEDAEAFINDIADQHFETGFYSFSSKFYNQALELFSKSSLSDYWLMRAADSLALDGNYLGAVKIYEDFMRIHYGSAYYAEGLRKLATLYYKKEPSIDSAISKLKNIVSEFSNEGFSEYAQLYIAMLYLRQEDYEAAFKEFKVFLYGYPKTKFKYSIDKAISDIEKKFDQEAKSVTEEPGLMREWKMYQAGKPITVSLEPLKSHVKSGKSLVFEVTNAEDEDKYSIFEEDTSDISRIPTMTKVGYDNDIFSLEWSAEHGKFLTEEHGATKTWRAPDKPGEYEVKVKISDIGVVRSPNRGSRDDKLDKVIVSVVTVRPALPTMLIIVILLLGLLAVVYVVIKRKK